MAASIRKRPLGRFRGPGESSGKRLFWALWEPDGTVMRVYVGEKAVAYALFPPGAFDGCRDMADVRMARPKDRGECRVEGGCGGISDAEAAGEGGEGDAYEAEYVIEKMTRVNPDDASDVDAEYVESRDFWLEGLDAMGGVWYDR